MIDEGAQELSILAHVERLAIAKLPRRKKTLFKSNHRLIAKVRIVDEGDEYRVVAAGLDAGKIPGSGSA